MWQWRKSKSKDRKLVKVTTKKQTWTIWYIVAGILGALLLHQIWNTARQTEAISYSEFEQLVAAKKVSEVVVGSDTIEGTLKKPAADGKSKVVR
jgi:cell division protease FtsH